MAARSVRSSERAVLPLGCAVRLSSRPSAFEASSSHRRSSRFVTSATSVRVPSPLAAEMRYTGAVDGTAVRYQRRGDRGTVRLSLVGREQVDLVQYQPALLRGERRVVPLEFGDDGAGVRDRIGSVHRRDVDEVQEQSRAGEMTQEAGAEPVAVRRALDEAGDVGHDEASVRLDRDHAEVRVQRGERVVGDLRARAAETRLISVDLPALGRPSRPTSASTRSSRVSSRRSPGVPSVVRRGARLVELLKRVFAESVEAATCHAHGHAVAVEIGDDLAALAVLRDGADRHVDDDVLAARPRAVAAATVLPRVGPTRCAGGGSRRACSDHRWRAGTRCRRRHRHRRRGRRAGCTSPAGSSGSRCRRRPR